VNTFLWIFIEWLNPVIMFFYPVCDWIMGWTPKLGGIWGMVAVGIITGLGVNLYQKFFSKQKLLGKCKSDLDKLKKSMSAAKKQGDTDRVGRLMSVSKRISGKYMWGSLKPAFITVPPVVVIAMWAGSRLGYQPVQPNQEVEIICCFENEARGYAHLVSDSPDVEILTDQITKIAKGEETKLMRMKRERLAVKGMGHRWWRVWTWFSEPTDDQKKAWIKETPAPGLGLEAHWEVRATETGTHKLTVRYSAQDGSQSNAVDFIVGQGNGPPPEFINFFIFDTPGMDHMQSLQFDIEDSMIPAWWNMCFQWMGVYVLVAIVGGVGFRFLLRVN
jgi:uncharacterized membrane protein (DUF106 family)